MNTGCELRSCGQVGCLYKLEVDRCSVAKEIFVATVYDVLCAFGGEDATDEVDAITFGGVDTIEHLTVYPEIAATYRHDFKVFNG